MAFIEYLHTKSSGFYEAQGQTARNSRGLEGLAMDSGAHASNY